MRWDRRVNRFHLGNIRLYLHDRRTRRYSPYVRTHRKFIEVAKESGGFDNVTAFSVWEIMKAEVDGVSPTLNDASSVLGMLQFMFPEYTISPPPMVTFYMNVKSEVGSYEAMAVASVNSGLLMAVMGLLFPAVLHATHTELHFGKSELALSRFSSYIMLVAYAAYLYFQLKSQRQLRDQVMCVLRKQEKLKNQPHQAKDNQETELRILLKSKEPGKSLVG
ncbi:hypothetical protein KPL71_017965 [Citrus sinensis]|uniref:Uncharacterized protein n=1 Tax=Citrus sinensis TaxID=2711 RepID=A0ACB8JU65_CITSI|nr:hypothetical protein KPL71_017965 [Citrus sinensis]